MRIAALIPAYQAAPTIGQVILALRHAGDEAIPVYVVDDGSTDATAERATEAGAHVLRHATNRGKGAALMTGFRFLASKLFDAVVTLDADLQHPADEAVRLARMPADQRTLILGVRDLRTAGAPGSSQFSNSVSNYFLSLFCGLSLADTQCGLRRYPLPQTLDLGLRSPGYALEAEVILRASHANWPIQQTPVRVIYPPKAERVSHFHVVLDPTRIVFRVLRTWLAGVLA